MSTDRIFASAVVAACCAAAFSTTACADELDRRISQVCEGLSSVFYRAGPREDALDAEIARDMAAEMRIGVLHKMAQVSGAAKACGVDISDAMSRIEQRAAAYYANDPAKSDRYLQILQCAEAQYERPGFGRPRNKSNCTETVETFNAFVLGVPPDD